MTGSGFFPEFPPRRMGIQLILPGDFQEGAWPVSGCQYANPWTKVRFQVFNFLFQMTNHLFTLVSKAVSRVQRPVQNILPFVAQRNQRL
jgi:hypothetical protein